MKQKTNKHTKNKHEMRLSHLLCMKCTVHKLPLHTKKENVKLDSTATLSEFLKKIKEKCVFVNGKSAMNIVQVSKMQRSRMCNHCLNYKHFLIK